MLADVISVKPLEGYRLQVQFEGGVSGIVNVKELVEFTGVFEYIKDEEHFAQVAANEELGVVCWPNGADLDSDVLYSIVTEQPLPEFEALRVLSS